MTRRSIIALLGVAFLLLAATGTAAAKDGGMAELDAPIHPDSEPGSLVDVGWRAYVLAGATESPVIGSPFFIRLTSVDGSETVEAAGTETPPGSGHYVAAVTIPQGGVSLVEIGMRGETCVEQSCYRSDVPFVLDDADRLPAIGAAAASAPRPAETASGASVPIAALVVACGAVLLAATRWRRPGPVALAPVART